MVIGVLYSASNEELYDRYWEEGNQHSEAGRWKEAAEAFSKAIRYYPALPGNYGTYVNRANAYSMQGRLDLALKDYSKVLAAFPDKSVKELGEVYYNRGAAYDRNGKPELAIPDYEKAIAIDSQIRSVHNKLAWILATSADDKIRNGEKAVKHGLIACEQTGNKNGYYLDTLAAAYAESGNFTKAVETQKLALDLMTDPDDKAEVAGRVTLYEQMKPYREPKKKK
jgi:tetratricopeptide (TPR) repeat protein